MATDVERLVVLLEANAENLRRNMRGGEQVVDRSTSRMERRLRTLQRAFVAVGAVIGAGALLRGTLNLADAYAQLDNRLRLVTDTEEQRVELMRRLGEVSNETYTRLGGTVELYTRLSQSLEGVIEDEERLLGITETINQAIALSGGNAQSAEAAITQLAQGMAAGALRGEELNSVMEQTPALAQLIADGLGLTIGELRAFAAEGELTTERLAQAVESQADTVRAQFSEMEITVSQATGNLNDALMQAVGTFDQASGASGGFAASIDMLADRIEENLPVIERLGQSLRPAAAAMNGVLAGVFGGPAPGMTSPTGGGGGWGGPAVGGFSTLPRPGGGIGVGGGVGGVSSESPLAQMVTEAEAASAALAGVRTEMEANAAVLEGPMKKALDTMTSQQQTMLDMSEAWAEKTGQVFAAFLQGTEQGVAALQRMGVEVAAQIAQQIALLIFQMMTGTVGSGGKTSPSPSVASAASLLSSFSAPGKAIGGPVSGGKAYVVGERGPELFVPRMGGAIVPNGAAAPSSPSFNIAIDARGAQMGVAEQIEAKIPSIMKLMDARIRDNAGRGGAFAGSLGRA